MVLPAQIRHVLANNMKKSGFTLIEMMITLAILGILISIALPSFTTMLERQKLKAATEQLLSIFNLAKTEAIKNNSLIYINAKKTSNLNWSIQVSTSTTCSIDSSCDLKSISSAGTPKVKITNDISTLDGASFNASRGLPSFTTNRSVTFSTDNYSVTSTISAAGLITQCSSPAFGGYSAC
jgi:type IV fimbrial biogenesis protein FimT